MTTENPTERAEALVEAAGTLMAESRRLIAAQLEGVPSTAALRRGLLYQEVARELLEEAALETAAF